MNEESISSAIFATYSMIPDVVHQKTVRIDILETIDHTRPWAYFDHTSNQQGCWGGGGYPLLNHTTSLSYQDGSGTRNEKFHRTASLETSPDLCPGKKLQLHSDFWILPNCDKLVQLKFSMLHTHTEFSS